MKFVSKEIAIKLKEKGFDRPCFGYYYIQTPTGLVEGGLVLNILKESKEKYGRTSIKYRTNATSKRVGC